MNNKYLLFIALFYFSLKLSAQDTLTTYYDKEWKKIRSKEKADHYKQSFTNKDGVIVFKAYYMSGELKATGNYKSKKRKRFNNEFIGYDKVGFKNSQGHFDNGKKTGKWIYWQGEDTLKNITHYDHKGKKTGLYRKWYKNGNVDIEGSFNENKEIGEWKYYYENGKIASSEKYNKGKLVDFKFWNEDGSERFGLKLAIFQQANYKNEFGGIKEYIKSNFIYPEEAKENSISGVVHISFTVEKSGVISNIKINKSVHKLLDEEAIRLIKGMQKWTPARYHNRIVSSTYNIPINFKI